MVGEDFRFLCTSLRFAFYLPAMGPMEERGGVFQVDDAEVGTFGFHPVGDVEQMLRRAREPSELRDDECVAFADEVEDGFKLRPLTDRLDLFGEKFSLPRQQ